MSIFKVTVNNTGIGRAGTSVVLCINNHSHIAEAREEILDWVSRDFVKPYFAEVEFVSHSTELYVSDITDNYERIKIFQ